MTTALAQLTTLGLGGPPRASVTATTDDELVAAVTGADAAGDDVLLVGGGSNLVVADAGVDATAVLVRTRGLATRTDGADDRVLLDVAAGEPWDEVVAGTVADGLAGLEALSGIPGSAGATPIQNVGAYGQEVAQSIVGVRALDRRTGEVAVLSGEELAFGYRTSALKRAPATYVVLGVTFALRRDDRGGRIAYAELAGALDAELGDRVSLHAVREAVLHLRRRKGMVLDADDPDTRSVGSFFTNPVLDVATFGELRAHVAARLGPGVEAPAWPQDDGSVKTSAAWLIERAGFARGYGDPRGAAISSKHVLALTNRGEATATELVGLAREIAAGVQKAFGLALEPEPVFAGHAWAGLAASARPS